MKVIIKVEDVIKFFNVNDLCHLGFDYEQIETDYENNTVEVDVITRHDMRQLQRVHELMRNLEITELEEEK